VDAVLGTALGLFVSAFAATEFQAVQFMPAVVLPQLLLCGLFVPRSAMPGVLEAISNVLPLSYAVDAMQTLTRTSEVADVWGDLAVVLAFVLGGLALGAATLRRRTP
jgi:ABC-2 type transport system permease protein